LRGDGVAVAKGGGMFRTGLILICVTAIVYFGITAVCGFELGRQIAHAKTNPLVAIGTQMIGRDQTEAYAIHKANFPTWITGSPSFWVMLRQSE
jgi:hypothetical protein